MKKKDFIYLILAGIIFLAAGYVGFTQLAPKSSASQQGVEVEVVGEIPAEMNSNAKQTISDSKKVQDFDAVLQFDQGLDNTQPFGK